MWTASTFHIFHIVANVKDLSSFITAFSLLLSNEAPHLPK